MPIYVVRVCIIFILDADLRLFADCDSSGKARPSGWRAQFNESCRKVQCHSNGGKCFKLILCVYIHDSLLCQIPTLASCSFDEIVDAATDGQVQFYQLYVIILLANLKKH